MIAIADRPESSQMPDWQVGFLELLPDIRNQLRFQFRNLRADEQAEAMAEAVANGRRNGSRRRGWIWAAIVASLGGR